jgi:hypothetical protein
MIRNKYYFTGSQGPPGPGINGPVTSTDNEMIRNLGVQGDSMKGLFWIQDDNGFVYNKEPGNKKDLAVYPGMTPRPREKMEGDVGNEPSKRYTITHYLPLWTRREVTISPPLPKYII